MTESVRIDWFAGDRNPGVDAKVTELASSFLDCIKRREIRKAVAAVWQISHDNAHFHIYAVVQEDKCYCVVSTDAHVIESLDCWLAPLNKKLSYFAHDKFGRECEEMIELEAELRAMPIERLAWFLDLFFGHLLSEKKLPPDVAEHFAQAREEMRGVQKSTNMKIEKAKIIQGSGMDVVLLYTSLPSPLPNVTVSSLVLTFQAAQGTGKQYVQQHFGDVEFEA